MWGLFMQFSGLFPLQVAVAVAVSVVVRSHDRDILLTAKEYLLIHITVPGYFLR